MPDAAPPTFLVNPDSDPVAVRVQGRASFQNSSCLQDFVAACLRAGRVKFAIDFKGCSGMDSTFLGVLAGVAIQLRKLNPPGSLVVCRLEGRNLELVRNLGLHRLLTIDDGGAMVDGASQALDCAGGGQSELDHARHVLQAHENLVEADAGNQEKFRDVLTFLKERVNQP